MSVGGSVYSYPLDEFGSVVRPNTLGFADAPTVRFADGKQVLYCGKTRQDICEYLPAILPHVDTTVKSAFLSKWKSLEKATKEAYYQGVVSAPDKAAYIEAVRHQIGA